MDENLKNQVLKFTSLGLLIPHTICYTILAAVARKPDADGHVFFSPMAVVYMEFGKLLLSLGATVHRIANETNQEYENGSLRKDEYIPIPDRSAGTSTEPEWEETETEKRQSAQRSTSGTGEYTLDMQHDSIDVETSGQTKLQRFYQNLAGEIFNTAAFRLIPPSILYVFQNNLQVFAAGYLTPAEYQIVGQTKLAFTAIFSVLILRRVLNYKHWLSIALLSIGAISVQLVSSSQIQNGHTVIPSTSTQGVAVNEPSHTVLRTQWSLMIGTLAMLGASICSGLGGVLIEVLLKKKMDFWTTNVFLAFFSLLPALVPVFANAIYQASFHPFQYFNGYVWALIVMNILGGIIASLSMKYADNILKNFAVAVSLIGTVYLSAIVVSVPITGIQVLGTALVIIAIAGYARA